MRTLEKALGEFVVESGRQKMGQALSGVGSWPGLDPL